MSLGADHAAGLARALELTGVGPTREALAARDVSLSPQLRTAVVAAIRRNTADLPEEVAREDALERLEAGADVIVCGQQPGLLGGPLLTLWKAATTVLLARERAARRGDCVAVFWNASEDHDLDEADRFFQFHKDGSVRLRHARLDGAGRSLDRITLTADQAAQVADWFEGTPPDECPRAGETLGRAATRMLHDAFASSGLIIVEPRWFADELAGLVGRVLSRRLEVRDSFLDGCRRVEAAGYDLQLDPPDDAWTGLFVSDDRGRRALRATTRGFEAGGEEWSADPDARPESISFSAALRPLAQRTLLPVVAQVCGPSETAYLAQLGPLFEHVLGCEAPLLWPRVGGLVLRPRHRAFATLFDLTDDDLSKAPDTWPRVSKELPPSWAETVQSIDASLREAFTTNDAELDRLLAPTRHGARKLMKELRKTLAGHMKDRNRPRIRARHELEQTAWPRGRPQDRVLAPASLGLKPATIVRAMLEAIDPFTRRRPVIEIPED